MAGSPGGPADVSEALARRRYRPCDMAESARAQIEGGASFTRADALASRERILNAAAALRGDRRVTMAEVERVGPRPDDPAAREQWDRAAAYLADYRHAFGHSPDNEPPSRSDYRECHAWEDVHKAAAKAVEMHPERPLVERPPPQLDHDIGLDIGM